MYFSIVNNYIVPMLSAKKTSRDGNRPGLTALDTHVCYPSLLYPFIRDNHEDRLVYFYQTSAEKGFGLARLPYHELPADDRRDLKRTDRKRRNAFYATCVVLAFTLIFFFLAFKVILVISSLATLYEYMDRRIRTQWLKREHARTGP
jgi:hypothetical protein